VNDNKVVYLFFTVGILIALISSASALYAHCALACIHTLYSHLPHTRASFQISLTARLLFSVHASVQEVELSLSTPPCLFRLLAVTLPVGVDSASLPTSSRITELRPYKTESAVALAAAPLKAC
jgi:hypothetical protein